MFSHLRLAGYDGHRHLPAEASAKAGVGEPVPTPDQVRGRLSPEHALAPSPSLNTGVFTLCASRGGARCGPSSNLIGNCGPSPHQQV
jgi:hypothetical protein